MKYRVSSNSSALNYRRYGANAVNKIQELKSAIVDNPTTLNEYATNRLARHSLMALKDVPTTNLNRLSLDGPELMHQTEKILNKIYSDGAIAYINGKPYTMEGKVHMDPRGVGFNFFPLDPDSGDKVISSDVVREVFNKRYPNFEEEIYFDEISMSKVYSEFINPFGIEIGPKGAREIAKKSRKKIADKKKSDPNYDIYYSADELEQLLTKQAQSTSNTTKGVLRNKGESVFSKTPLQVTERTGKFKNGYDVFGINENFDIEGVIKSTDTHNYLIGILGTEGAGGSRYLLSGKAKKTPENKWLQDKTSFSYGAKEYIDNGIEAPYWVRKRAAKNFKRPIEPTTRKYDSKKWSTGQPKYYTKKLKTGTAEKTYLDKDGVEVAKILTRKDGTRAVARKRSRRQDEILKQQGKFLFPNTTYLISRYDPKTKTAKIRSNLRNTNNKPIQQEQQLLLEAPKQKEPRKPRREYKSDLGTNTEPIELSGPVKPKQKVEVSLDDFKTKTEIDNMDIEDNNFEIKEEPEVSPTSNSKLQRQSRRQQRKAENEANNRKRTNTQQQQFENRQNMNRQNMNNQSRQTIDLNKPKQDQNIFSELSKRDSDLLYTAETDAYKLNLRNSLPDSIKYGNKSYQFKYDENGAFNLFDAKGNILAHDTEEFGSIYSAIATEREKYLYNLSNEEWDMIFSKPERFGFDSYGKKINGDDARLWNKIDAYNKRKEILSNQSRDAQLELNDTPRKEKDKIKELKNKRNELDKQNYEIDRRKFEAESKYQAKEDRRKVREQFQQKVKEEGLDKGSEAYQQAEKELKEKFEKIKIGTNKSIERQNNRIDAKIKGLEGKSFSIGNAINVGFTAKAAVDKYKESKAEGKSTASSFIRAASSAAVAEVLGPTAQIGLDIAKAVPKAVIGGADALYKENRRMNSAANFIPLGGVNYQDSQELATMRQSGMELAKMSQYNLEQTLMGAEAKHLHR